MAAFFIGKNMDRQIVWSGAIPLETDLLNTNKYAMIGLAKLAAAIMGSSTYVRGLDCVPTSPASMVVNVGAGEIYSLDNIDNTAYSSLAADTTHSILKQGILLDAASFTLTAPGTSGYSVNYLIQATYSDTDNGATVLPYYNADNPTSAWSGPNNSGTSQSTVRKGVCTVSMKAGVAATTGTQTTPSPDTGYTGLYVITVAQGATTVTAANISKYANAPFLPETGLVDGIQRGALNYAADTGAANAYVVNINPGVLSLSDGMSVSFKATNANTGSSTLNVCGTGAYPLITIGGQTLVGGEIPASSLVNVQWSESLSSWLISQSSSAPLPVLQAVKPNQAPQLQQVLQIVQDANAGLIGAMRNAKMSVPSAGATATFTADEIIVADSLSGRQFRLTSFSQTINLDTTGVNGMDTGTVPASGYVALYAIYNPTTQTAALLAVDATSAAAPEIYGGSNLPSGYTASALVSVWRTSSSLLVVGYQRDRHISIPLINVYTTTTGVTTVGAVSFSAAVPLNGKRISAYITAYETNSGTGVELSLYSSPTLIDILRANSSVSGATAASIARGDLVVIDPQALYFAMATTNNGSYGISCIGYDF